MGSACFRPCICSLFYDHLLVLFERDAETFRSKRLRNQLQLIDAALFKICKVAVKRNINTAAIRVHIVKRLHNIGQELKPQQRGTVLIKIEQLRALDACPITDCSSADCAVRAFLIMTDNAD